MLNLLANPDEYSYNVISVPGLNRVSAASQITTLVSNAQNRGDNIAVVDMVPYGTALATVTTQCFRNGYLIWCYLLALGTGCRS
jgi:hypothetical protein